MAWNVEEILKNHPINYANSFEAVLFREVVQYNKLIMAIKRSLADVQQAVKGFEVMSQDRENLCNEIIAGVVPSVWKGCSYLRYRC